MKLFIIPIIAVVIAISTTICVYYKIKSDQKVIDLRKSNNEEIKQLYKLSYVEMFDIGKSVSLQNICSKNSTNEKTNFDSILICLRIPGESCTACLDEKLDQFQILADSIGLNKVILVNYDEDIYVQYLKNRHIKLEKSIFNVKNLNLDAENFNHPYYFILNKNSQVCNIHIADRHHSERTKLYLNGIHKVIDNIVLAP